LFAQFLFAQILPRARPGGLSIFFVRGLGLARFCARSRPFGRGATIAARADQTIASPALAGLTVDTARIAAD
jgi:hypothetical protein